MTKKFPNLFFTQHLRVNVVKNTVINNFDSFWNFVDQNKESLSLEEWKILKVLFSKGNQNYYINSLYNLYKYGIDYQKFQLMN